jgi:hypothetical protein
MKVTSGQRQYRAEGIYFNETISREETFCLNVYWRPSELKEVVMNEWKLLWPISGTITAGGESQEHFNNSKHWVSKQRSVEQKAGVVRTANRVF